MGFLFVLQLNGEKNVKNMNSNLKASSSRFLSFP